MTLSKKYLYAGGIFAGVLLLLCVAAFYWESQRIPDGVVDWRGRSEVSVVLTEKGFEPSRIRIDRGTKVVFSTTRDKEFWPASNPHPVHTLYSAFDARGPIAPRTFWSFAPQQPGVWGYHDHVRSYFTGILYVE